MKKEVIKTSPLKITDGKLTVNLDIDLIHHPLFI